MSKRSDRSFMKSFRAFEDDLMAVRTMSSKDGNPSFDCVEISSATVEAPNKGHVGASSQSNSPITMEGRDEQDTFDSICATFEGLFCPIRTSEVVEVEKEERENKIEQEKEVQTITVSEKLKNNEKNSVEKESNENKEDTFDKVMGRFENTACQSGCGLGEDNKYLNSKNDVVDQVFEGLHDLPALPSLEEQKEGVVNIISEGVSLVVQQHQQNIASLLLPEEEDTFDKVMESIEDAACRPGMKGLNRTLYF